MVMLTDILKQRGVFSREIKARFKNGQVTINGDVVREDVDLLCSKIFEVGEFLPQLVSNNIWFLRIKIFGLENLFNTNIKNDLTEFLEDFIFVRTSKKDSFIIMKDKRKHKQV